MKAKFLLGSLFVSAFGLHAATITGLFNTGVDASGNALAATGATDIHYTVISTPTSTMPASAVTYFNGAYLADSSISDWISVNSSGSSSSSGTYVFQTSFTIGLGLDPSTASITGRFGVDNELTAIQLNGVTVSTNPGAGFFSYTALNITSGFQSGLNILDFTVHDDGQPMGFRLDSLVGTVSASATSATPEPASVFLLAVGVLGLSWRTVRARKLRV